MAVERLIRHYDEKYADALSPGTPPRIGLVDYPDDRFEACVKYVVELFQGEAVLEVGGGDGLIARSLLGAGLDCGRYEMTDLSEVRVQQAAQSIDDPRVKVQVLDIESDAFLRENTESFDCVIMVALIEHLIDPISAMTTLAACLRPGGFVYISTPNIAKWTRRIRLMLGQFPSTASRNEGLTGYDGGPVDLHDEGHLHYFTFRSLSHMLCDYCGYSCCRKAPYWEGMRLFPKPLEHALARAWPGLFSELSLVAYK